MGLLGGGRRRTAEPRRPSKPARPPTKRGQFVSHVLGDTEETWTAIFTAGRPRISGALPLAFRRTASTPAAARRPRPPGLSTARPISNVYIDLAFFRQLETEFAAQGDFAKAYVIAHEVGHHVQTVLGTSDKVRAAQQRALGSRSQCAAGENGAAGGLLRRHLGAPRRQRAPARRGRRHRRSADAPRPRSATTPSRSACQGHVNQESFTHGSGAQRQQWFRKGYASGRVQDCNTFQ